MQRHVRVESTGLLMPAGEALLSRRGDGRLADGCHLASITDPSSGTPDRQSFSFAQSDQAL
jgi:hypothetical protein